MDSLLPARQSDATVNELIEKPEVTRFKGLDEISPREFAQFIGPEMRLSNIEHAAKAEVAG